MKKIKFRGKNLTGEYIYGYFAEKFNDDGELHISVKFILKASHNLSAMTRTTMKFMKAINFV